MDQGVMVVDTPPPPLARRPTPYHLFLLRLILVACIAYALFEEIQPDDVTSLHSLLRIAVMSISVTDVVYCYAYLHFPSKTDANDSKDYDREQKIYIGSRAAINFAGMLLMWLLGVHVRFNTLADAYFLITIVDVLLLKDYNKGFLAPVNDNDDEEENAETDLVSLEEFWTSKSSRTQIRFRMLGFIIFIFGLLFERSSEIPSVHFPVRVIFCILYVADSYYQFSRVYYANPQTSEELSEYLELVNRYQYNLLLWMFGPGIYFSLFSPFVGLQCCFVATTFCVETDADFFEYQKKYFKNVIRQKKEKED